jgi:hypothetical protein
VPQPWRRSTGLSYSRLRRERRATSDELSANKKALRDLDHRKAREGQPLGDGFVRSVV